MDYLEHHGILGQKWGVRRFQNPDGTRTPEGLKRYSTGSASENRGNIMSKASNAISKAGDTISSVRQNLAQRESDQREKNLKAAKALNYESKKTKKLKQLISDIDEDTEDFRPYTETGIKTKKGKTLLTGDDVKGLIAGNEEWKYKTKGKLEKQQKRDFYKANAIVTKRNMNSGQKVANTILYGPFGNKMYSNYKSAGYSTLVSYGQMSIDAFLGPLSIGRSTRVRNRAADRS